MHLCEPFLSGAPHAYFGAPLGCTMHTGWRALVYIK